MGEKGNLLDTTQEVFANLAEQGPQFWLSFEEYRKSRAGSTETHVVAGQQAATVADRDVVAHDNAG